MPELELTDVEMPVSVQPPSPTEGDEIDNSAPSSEPTVGIIFPPPEVRNVVDKTASFVARNGPEFESRIRKNEINNPKFNFLNAGDPYYAYYQHKVKESQEESTTSTSANVPVGFNATTHQKQQEILKQVEKPFVPKDPPSDFEFMADPPSIEGLDLDIVKLTAQFVARNGRQFLTNLMNREQRNFQFDFMRPQHSLFPYFTQLLEQYTKVLIPPKDILQKLRDEIENPGKILQEVKYRADWIKHEETKKRKQEEELERERHEYSQIDWHDFVVVETVDYQQFEIGHFPPPTTPSEVGARMLMQEHIEGGDVEMESDSDSDDEMPVRNVNDNNRRNDKNEVEDMEEDSSEDERKSPESDSKENTDKKIVSNMQPPLLPPVPGNVVIKKGYDPKKKTINSAPDPEYLISPLTGERIPTSKVQEHMRIGLLDPRWIEQRDKFLDKRTQESVLAPGTAIEDSLKQLAERRTDIFGFADEETTIGEKIGEENKKKEIKVVWDGHNSSVEAASRAARANISLGDQIHQIHKFKGLVPDDEKEKIGPKRALQHQDIITANPTVTLKADPKPPTPKLPQPMPPHNLLPQHMPMPPMCMPQPMMPHPAMMMMAPMPPMPPMPPHPMMAPFMPPPIPPLPTHVHQIIDNKRPGEPMENGHTGKKLRTEDALIPEQTFLAAHQNPVQLTISTPVMPDRSEWKLNGQNLSIILAPTDTIATMKAKIGELTGMAPGKQKLLYEGMFFKDNNTVAYYNLVSGSVINLQPKERGGRKK